MKNKSITPERGQSIVIIALLFLAFGALLALVLDGGGAYAARRQAQNAADAGALAGATYMCEYRSEAGGVNRAIEYAVLNGAANPPDVYADLGTGTVIVTATVQVQPFFAGLIGFSEIAPSATAEAQCQPPVGMGIMPVAWSCRETVLEGEYPTGVGCEQVTGPCAGPGDPYGLACTYVLMDSVKVKSTGTCNNPNNADDPDCYEVKDIICDDPLTPGLDPGTIDCDLNNDGINDLMTGGARSWLDLNGGGGGANELKNWLQNGFPGVIYPHTWVPEQSGVTTSVFHAASYMVGRDVILPVFEKLCPTYPNIYTDPESNESCTYGPDDNRTLAQNNWLNFHVVTFSQFHVTCVQTAQNRVWSEAWLGLRNNDPCPGHDSAVTAGSIRDNDKTIEGYFTDQQIYSYGGSGDWTYAGTFVVVLVR
jgi:hypothetical protein